MANTVISLKKSATPSAIPDAANIAYGEIAINYYDGKLYYKNASNVVTELKTTDVGNYFGSVNANGTLVVADVTSDVFTLVAGNNVQIEGDGINDTITISASVPGGGDPAPAFNQANTARDQANSAYAQANAAFAAANIEPDYVTANAAYITANLAWAQANTGVNDAANANAYVVVVGAASNTWTNTAISYPFAQANAAYDYANIIYAQANAAFLAANIEPDYVVANAAYNQANTATSDAANANAYVLVATAGSNAWTNTVFGYANNKFIANANGTVIVEGHYAIGGEPYVVNDAYTSLTLGGTRFGSLYLRDAANRVAVAVTTGFNDRYFVAYENNQVDTAGIIKFTTLDDPDPAFIAAYNKEFFIGSSTDYTEKNGIRFYPNTASNGRVAFVTFNNERMYVLHDGNVAIGRDTADYKLDVAGTINTASYYLNGINLLTISNTYTDTSIAYPFVQANLAYAQANTGVNDAANANAYIALVGAAANAWTNTSVVYPFSQGNNAFDQANAAYAQANTARDKANTATNDAANANAYVVVVGAASNTWANTKLANTSGVTFAGDLNVSGILIANSFTSSNGFIDLGPGSIPSYKEGRIYYDNINHALTVYSEDSGFILPLGQKEYVKVFNNSGNLIEKGKAVYATGYHTTSHQHFTIDLADASDVNKYDVIGLAGANIANSSHGYVITRGWLGGINTSSLTQGQRFHLGYSSPGSLVTVAPEYPNYPYDIGYCTVSDSTNGYLYIDRQSHTQEGLRVTGAGRISGDLTVEGDFTVLGAENRITVNSLQVGTQFVYLGVGDSISNANVYFTGSGLNDLEFRGHYESSGCTTFYVKITGTGTPDKFSWSYLSDFSVLEGSNVNILYQTSQLLSNGISVYFNANTGHTYDDKWNATAFGVSTDFGFVGNHTDGPNGYTHAGLFRDATDGTFKFFRSYDAEPQGNIDIANNTYNLANVQVDGLTADKVTGTEVYEGAIKLSTAIQSAAAGANAWTNTSIGSSFDQANTGRTHANNAYAQANQAFTKANNAGGGYYQGNNGDVGGSAGLGDIFRVHTNTLTTNTTIYSGNNALASGPLTIGQDRVLTIQSGARVAIV